MIVSKEYTVLLRIANLAGVNLPIKKTCSTMYVPSIVVENGDQPPIRAYQRTPYSNKVQYDGGVIYVGSEWLQNNLSDEEMAQWVALRLLGKLDKPAPHTGGMFNNTSKMSASLKTFAEYGIKAKDAVDAFAGSILVGDIHA